MAVHDNPAISRQIGADNATVASADSDYLAFILLTWSINHTCLSFTHTQTDTPFVRDYPGEPVPER